MMAAIILVESLRRLQALQEPITVTVSAGDLEGVINLEPRDATHIADALAADIELLQMQAVAALRASRLTMSTVRAAATVADPTHLERALQEHPDLLAWVSDSEAAVAEALGTWALEQPPLVRLLAVKAVAEGDAAALDRIDPRWRHRGATNEP